MTGHEPGRDTAEPTAAERMTVAASRALRDGSACFVGIGLPSTAANLARRTHAPDVVLIYESGTLGSKPGSLPLSIGDGILAETADAVITVPEVFNYWLQPGRVDVGFLGVLEPDAVTRELTLTGVHEGVGVDEVRAATGWELAVADEVSVLAPPTEQELRQLRALEATKGKA